MKRRRWKRWHVVFAGVLLPVITVGAYLGILQLSGNFHPATTG